MTKQELEEYLFKEGFEKITDEDDEETCYENDKLNITCHIDPIENSDNPEQVNINFGHSTDGWHSIKNATLDQIKTVVSIIKSSTWTGMEDIKLQKNKLHISLLNLIKELQ